MTPPLIRIADTTIQARAGETILASALRVGIALPNGCRVGACGACKCRVAKGSVRELTESAYLLDADELAAGVVLACQAVPTSDVEIESTSTPGTAGIIIDQAMVARDVVSVVIELARPITYEPGQHALVTLDGVSRVYSFAAPPNGKRVRLLVRVVPNGRLSSRFGHEDLTGREVFVGPPLGDFRLEAGTTPLLFVAGGSGLAPILAMLHAAAEDRDERDVTVLFGVRDEPDLYALDELESIRRHWRGRFSVVPVLSAVRTGSTWVGARGLVHEHVSAYYVPTCAAYVCGPPAMTDAVVDALHACGVTDIACDRFVTAGDAPRRERARLRDYVKFSGFHAIALYAVAVLLAGGATTALGLAALLALYIVGDAVLGDDTTTPSYTAPRLLTLQLWLALPLITAIVYAAVTTLPGRGPLGVASSWLLTSLMIGLVGTIPAHELTHRTWDRISMMIGRWLLAFSFDTSFAIEHVHGHHRYVATSADPATAPRGRNVYAHVLISTLKGNASAWQIESGRLAKRGKRSWSLANRFLRGHAMSGVLVVTAGVMGGATGAAFFAACALGGKALLEIVNYMEHYGLVRDPATKVEPHHSWNTNRRISSWAMFNLTRHSHHHAHGEVPFHELEPYPDAPMMISGYLSTIVIALVPPLWHRVMEPKLAAWDLTHATARERALVRSDARSQTGPRRGLRTDFSRDAIADSDE